MKLRTIEYDDSENPSVVTVDMTIQDAAFVAKITGGMSANAANAVIRDGALSASSIYDCLVGLVFNPYWDEGIDGYLNQSGGAA